MLARFTVATTSRTTWFQLWLSTRDYAASDSREGPQRLRQNTSPGAVYRTRLMPARLMADAPILSAVDVHRQRLRAAPADR